MGVAGKGKKAPNGSGSIWQRPDGRWGAALSYPYFDPFTCGTKSRRISTTKNSWEAAHKWLVQKQIDLLGGVPDAPENAPFGEFLAGWLRDVVDPAGAPKTREKRAYHVNSHVAPALGHIKMKDLGARQIHGFNVRMARRDPPLAHSTRRDVFVTLKMALKQAVRWGLIPQNPAEFVDPPRPGPSEEDEDDGEKIRALSDAQARAFFEHAGGAGSRWRNYYVCAVRTGLRPGEMLGLQWRDLALGVEVGADRDLDSLRVRRTLGVLEGGGTYTKVPKSKASRRTVPLHWEASEAFAAQRDLLGREGLPAGPKAWVFPSTTGGPMRGQNLRQRHLQPALAAAGLPRLTLHELRHTFASIMLYEWRVPVEVVAKMMGHENENMTRALYAHLIRTAQADAIRSLRRMLGPPEAFAV